MNYDEVKAYIKSKYTNVLPSEEIDILFTNVENLYLSKTSPFDLSVKFDKENQRATSWVIRAVNKILEEGDIDILSYSENGLAIKLGTSMMTEITPFAGVGGNRSV